MTSPINIFSGERGLGGALTFPTCMSFDKKSIENQYPVVYEGVRFPDAEACYHFLKPMYKGKEEDLYANIAATKFFQHPRLAEAVKIAGGLSWLESCSHFTGAESDRFKRWEGQGLESKFIRLLCKGYQLYLDGVHFTDAPQSSLF